MKAEKILSTVLTVVLAVSAWTLKEVVALKVSVARLETKIAALPTGSPAIVQSHARDQRDIDNFYSWTDLKLQNK